MKRLLLIFAKNPIAGRAKTRLTKDLGPEMAMEIYRGLLNHTSAICEPVNAAKQLHYADYINTDDMWPNDVYEKLLQRGEDLGQRMSYAFAQAFADGFESVIIIGTDCRELQTEDLEKAFESLETKDSVLGPANDGGYYLLGMNKLVNQVFLNKEWSTESVFEETLNDLRDAGLSTEVLPVKVDVDNASDLNETFI